MIRHPEKINISKRVTFLEDTLKRRTGELIREMDLNLRIIKEFFSHSPSLIAVTDTDGRIIYVNNTFSTVMGYTLDDLREKVTIFNPASPQGEKVMQNIKDALARNESWSGELEVITRYGRSIWLSGIISTFPTGKNIVRRVAVFNDITSEVELRGVHYDQALKYQMILEKVPVVIFMVNREGKIRFLNYSAHQFSFSNQYHAIGKDVDMSEAFPPEYADRIRHFFQWSLENKLPFSSEEQINHAEGDFYLHINGAPIFDPDLAVKEVMFICEDITTTRRNQKLLNIQAGIDSVSNLMDTVEASLEIAAGFLRQIEWIDGFAVYLLDESSGFLDLIYAHGLSDDLKSKVGRFSITESSVAEILTKKVSFFDSFEFVNMAEIFREEGILFGACLPLNYQNHLIGALNIGSRKAYTVDAFTRQTIESIASRLATLITLARTRSQLSETTIELKRKLYELETNHQMLIQKSRLESLGELSAGFSHEISQPLAVMSLVMENILHKLNDGQVGKVYLERKLATMGENITKIQTLIEHMRIFSRDHAVLTLDHVDVNERIHSALTMIGAQLRKRQIRVITDLSSGDCFTVGNASRFEQVVLNLLTNARDAIELKAKQHTSDGQPRQIRITTRPNGKMIEFSVWDNGVGVSAENLDRLFNPFFTTKSGGTGLGLPIVYGIVSEMYGTITARSQPMEFTEITVSLPLHHPRKEDQKPQP